MLKMNIKCWLSIFCCCARRRPFVALCLSEAPQRGGPTWAAQCKKLRRRKKICTLVICIWKNGSCYSNPGPKTASLRAFLSTLPQKNMAIRHEIIGTKVTRKKKKWQLSLGKGGDWWRNRNFVLSLLLQFGGAEPPQIAYPVGVKVSLPRFQL